MTDPAAESSAMAVPTAGEADALGDLFARLAGGERAALGELYDRTARSLFGLALVRSGSRSTAEEAVQETFVRLAASHADLAAVRRPRAYLFASLRRALADLQRQEGRTTALAEDEATRLLEPRAGDPLRAVEIERLEAALRRLSPKLREAIYLRYLEELSLREVAEATGAPLFTIASRCRLALARLRRLLDGRSR